MLGVKKIIILGGGGNGGIVVSCVKDMNERYNDYNFSIMGFLNDMETEGSILHGYPVLGKTKEYVEYLKNENVMFIFAIHPIGHGDLRLNIYNELNIPKNRLATIIHPSAFVSYNSTIKPGVLIEANSYVGANTVIGESTVLKANSLVGHDVVTGKLCHLSRGCVVGSFVQMSDAVDIALNATVLEKVKIGKHAVVGAAAMVTKDVKENQIVVGNPQKFLRLISDKRRY